MEGKVAFPNQFDYHRPSTIVEAVSLLQQNPDAKILAGGHSLLPAMKLRLAAPGALVDLSKVDGLKGISTNGNVVIGAMTTYAELRDSADLKRALPIIAETAYHVGDSQVQAVGTLGGSLAHNDPAADFTAVALALDASVKAVGANGERTIPVEEFFVDLLTTSLAPDEVVTEIHIPGATGKTGMAYEKFRHPASGYAVVGVAAVVTVGADGNVGQARIAVTGATSKATRATVAEQALVGKPLSADSIAAAAAVAGEALELNGDHYASAEYRAHLLHVYTQRALERAAASLG
jgi:carbon-monoxide dehydrogenase medium subunit